MLLQRPLKPWVGFGLKIRTFRFQQPHRLSPARWRGGSAAVFPSAVTEPLPLVGCYLCCCCSPDHGPSLVSEDCLPPFPPIMYPCAQLPPRPWRLVCFSELLRFCSIPDHHFPCSMLFLFWHYLCLEEESRR